ncbi:1, 4-beta cellobiohydrolase, partial [Kalaharituber pfeilii]
DYNAYRTNPHENFMAWGNSWDECHYAQSLTPHLEAARVLARSIVDVGRSGLLGIRSEWGNWCNIKGAGFGPVPTTNTNATNVDALVWAKPGGESDGTSDPSSASFDTMCAGPNAHVPAPEAGAWFDEYAMALITNANPAIPPLWF